MDGGTRAREIKSISLLGFRLILHWKVQFEFGRKLVFGVKAIGEVNATNSTIGVDLNSESFDVVGSVGSPREI